MLSKATIGRLPGYLEYINSLPPHTTHISATTIARGLNLGEVQVRKDLSAVCGTGKPRVGYSVVDLSNALGARCQFGMRGRHSRRRKARHGTARLRGL